MNARYRGVKRFKQFQKVCRHRVPSFAKQVPNSAWDFMLEFC